MPFEIKAFPVKYLLFLLAATALPAVQGCAAAAVPAVAYGVSKLTAPATTQPPSRPSPPPRAPTPSTSRKWNGLIWNGRRPAFNVGPL